MSVTKIVFQLFGFMCLIACAVGATTSESLSVLPTATKGMVIDGGSGGSRMHVYTWKERRFSTVPPPLSFPEGNEKWTARISPGIAAFSDNIEGIAGHLAPLIAFAKSALMGFEDQFQNFPIYFYATGGMRQLDFKKRDKIIDEVRRYLTNDTLCPFFFKHDFARVISGELIRVKWARKLISKNVDCDCDTFFHVYSCLRSQDIIHMDIKLFCLIYAHFLYLCIYMLYSRMHYSNVVPTPFPSLHSFHLPPALHFTSLPHFTSLLTTYFTTTLQARRRRSSPGPPPTSSWARCCPTRRYEWTVI